MYSSESDVEDGAWCLMQGLHTSTPFRISKKNSKFYKNSNSKHSKNIVSPAMHLLIVAKLNLKLGVWHSGLRIHGQLPLGGLRNYFCFPSQAQPFQIHQITQTAPRHDELV